MRLMKNSGIEWIGDIPSDWTLKRNKVVFSCSKDIVGNNSANTQLLSLTTRGVKLKSQDTLGGKTPESFDTYQYVNKDDIIMCLFDLDCSAVFSGISPYDGMISPAYKILKCRESVYPKYADYWFSFVFIDRKFKSYAKNLRYTLNYDEFADLLMICPSYAEQKKIADYLDEKCAEIDTVIEKTKATIEEYKKLKQSVITQAVTKGIRPNRPMKDSGIEWVDKIPQEWENRKMILILSMRVIDGPHESPELFDSGIPYISANAIENGKINFSKMRGYISEEYSNICDLRYKPQRNDILMIKLGATTGQVAIVETDERFNIWVPLAAIRCNDIALPKFVYYALQSDYYLRQMELSWTFGTQQTLGVKTIERLRIILPEYVEQKEIADYLDKKCSEIDELIAKKTSLLSELESYKKSLIYEYVTGKKEV